MITESLPKVLMSPSCYLPSTWRDPIGPVLTNRAIIKRALEGWYGPVAKLRAEKSKAIVGGRVIKCQGLCNGDNNATMGFLKWSYLPKAGYYCATCTKAYRAMKEKETSLSQRLAARIREEYV